MAAQWVVGSRTVELLCQNLEPPVAGPSVDVEIRIERQHSRISMELRAPDQTRIREADGPVRILPQHRLDVRPLLIDRE